MKEISINAANKDVLKRKWSVHILIGHSLLHLNNLVGTFIRVKSVWITNLLSWKICHLAVTFGSSDNAVKYSHYFLHKTGIKHGKNTEFCSKKKDKTKNIKSNCGQLKIASSVLSCLAFHHFIKINCVVMFQ